MSAVKNAVDTFGKRWMLLTNDYVWGHNTSKATRGTADEVEEEVRRRIRTIAPGGGYCCGASNSVPEYVPYDNYIAMIDAVKKYGKYPIRL